MRNQGWVRALALVSGAVLSLASARAELDEAPRARGSYKEVRAFLASLAAKYPERAEVISIGVSDSGRPIEALRIGDGSVKNLVVATHHGNEYGSTEVAKAFAASVAADPIPGQTLYVVPVLNISGYEAGSRWETVAGRSYDPNRDYPGPCGSEGPWKLKSTAALARFLEQEGIVASATLHTFSPAVVYPWGLSTRDVDTLFTDLFRMLAQAATVESRYAVGNSADLIYPADGTFEDYAFWRQGTWSMLFELGPTHSPGSAQLAEMVRVNVPGLRRMFEQAPRQAADHHEFKGRCDTRLRAFDPHLE